ATKLTVDRIFASTELRAETYGPVRWSTKRSEYTMKMPSERVKGAHDIVRLDPTSGRHDVVVSAEHLIPKGESTPLVIEDFEWSNDESTLLIYTNSKPVWRRNSRGDYWVVHVMNRELYRLGGNAAPSTLMFARFSPDGRRVAYVRERNLYVEDVAGRQIRQMT